MDKKKKIQIQSDSFVMLLNHLRENTELQNIDLMNLAGFCRNCISKWYVKSAKENGVDLSYEDAREIIYDMPYEEWKEKFQK
tara:strand:- start:1167 stop:1412 length:246 start_codon:yes stop_codon:yes gene_type:complete